MTLPDPPSRREEISADGETVFTHDTRGWIEELQGACVLLAELPQRVSSLLEEHMREEEFAENDFLIRQGDPGEAIALVSLEDELVVRYVKIVAPLTAALRRRRPDARVPASIGAVIFRIAQRHARAIARSQRRSVLKTDDWLEDSLGFAGWTP